MAEVAGKVSLVDAGACFTISLLETIRNCGAEINNVCTDIIGAIGDSAAGFSAWSCTSRHRACHPGNRVVGRLRLDRKSRAGKQSGGGGGLRVGLPGGGGVAGAPGGRMRFALADWIAARFRGRSAIAIEGVCFA